MIEISICCNIQCDNPECKKFKAFSGFVPYGLDSFDLADWIISEERIWWIKDFKIRKVFCSSYCQEEFNGEEHD